MQKSICINVSTSIEAVSDGHCIVPHLNEKIGGSCIGHGGRGGYLQQVPGRKGGTMQLPLCCRHTCPATRFSGYVRKNWKYAAKTSTTDCKAKN